MKKIVPFIKEIKFNTRIYEITSISLENTLSSSKDNIISGEFIVSGEYKINDSSINTEPFIYGLPFDINLDSKYDLNNLKIDVDDFKYEILNEEFLRVNIDILLDNIVEKEEIEEITPDYVIEERTSIKDEEKENNVNLYTEDLFKEEKEEKIMVDKVLEENPDFIPKKATSIFENFNVKDEKYVSYYVHIVRNDDTIESIMKKYNVSIDDLRKYNNIDQITLGNKIIIPYIDNETI